VSVSNLTLVQELYEAFARRNPPAVLVRLPPAVELQETELVPGGGHYRGHAGARTYFERVVAAIAPAVSIERFIDAEVYSDAPAIVEALGSR
jgi:uncharacterized protein